MNEYDDSHPEVIKAKAESREKILKARSTLHPSAQVIYTIMDKLENMVHMIGCFIILLVIIGAIFSPQLFDLIFFNRRIL